VPDIEPLTDEEEALLSGGTVTTPVNGVGGLSINDAAPNLGGEEMSAKEAQARRMAHRDENKKWEKAAKKAEKDAGAANMHLASS
jgi:hypothetical protein